MSELLPFKTGDYVRKKGDKGQWHGKIVGTYSTVRTPEGYAVESVYEKNSVQIYPASALEPWTPTPPADDVQRAREQLESLHQSPKLVRGGYDYQCGYLDALDEAKKLLDAALRGNE